MSAIITEDSGARIAYSAQLISQTKVHPTSLTIKKRLNSNQLCYLVC